jgi:hypothetical protein
MKEMSKSREVKWKEGEEMDSWGWDTRVHGEWKGKLMWKLMRGIAKWKGKGERERENGNQ